jgi:hypothetical protein
MAEIVDLRGREVALPASQVLADPSGRRARVLARGGRIVAVLFSVWFVGLALAGLGILPSGYVPLGSQISAPPTPPKSGPVQVAQPSRTDLLAAKPVANASAVATRTGLGVNGGGGTQASASGGSSRAGSGGARHHGGSALGGAPSTHQHGRAGGGVGAGGKTGGGSTGGGATTGGGTTAGGTTGTISHGKGTAPGQTHKTTTPGHTKTAPPGNSGSAPGHQTTTTTTTTTTTPGKSGSAPGQTGLQGNGSGHGN